MAQGDQHTKAPAREPHERPIGARLQFWANLLAKLTVPVGAAVAAWLSIQFEQRASTRALLNQREQAETSLKATMFGELIGPIIGPGKDGQSAVDPMQYALLVRLLALNFHEDFEFEPLMQSADDELVANKAKYSSEEVERARFELRSVAHRVSDRQIARLWDDTAGSCADPAHPDVTIRPHSDVTIYVLSRSLSSEELRGLGIEVSAAGADGPLAYSLDGDPDQLPDLYAPNCKDSLNISFHNAQWNNRTIDVDVEQMSLPKRAPPQPYVFQLTPFTVPFSDNTPLADGNRFAVYQNDTSTFPDGVSIMRVRLRWFPLYYYPPTERPSNPMSTEQQLKIGPGGR